MRLALLIAIALLLTGLAAGCGSSSSTERGSTVGGSETGPASAATEECGAGSVRVSGVACQQAEAVLAEWRKAPGCAIVGNASHASCQISGYLCIAARQGSKAAVSCAQPGKSILFAPTE
jgi:hypothetical protein